MPRSHTIAGQLDLDGEFKKAGILGVPSTGITPGWAALAAQSVIDKLDKVNDVIIRFADCLDTDEMLPPINATILAMEFFGPPAPMRTVHGKVEEVDLVSSREVFEFPAPIGPRTIYTVTEHPDIVTIPTYCGKDIHICEEKFGWFLGNNTMEDDMSEMYSIGHDTIRKDAYEKATGKAMFSADYHPPGMLYGKLLVSEHPHAIIKSIDTSEAEKMDGVICIMTGKDVPDERTDGYIHDRHILVKRVARYVGDPLAAVAATTMEKAEKAVAAIKVEYEVLPHMQEARRSTFLQIAVARAGIAARIYGTGAEPVSVSCVTASSVPNGFS